MQCRSPSPKLCAVLGAPFRCRGAHMVLAPISLTCGSWSRVRGFLPLQFQRLEADYRQASATRKRNRSRQATSSATRKRDIYKIRRAGDGTTLWLPSRPSRDRHMRPTSRAKLPAIPEHHANRTLPRLFMADSTVPKSLLRLFVAPKTRYAGYRRWNSNPYTRHIRKQVPQTSHLAESSTATAVQRSVSAPSASPSRLPPRKRTTATPQTHSSRIEYTGTRPGRTSR